MSSRNVLRRIGFFFVAIGSAVALTYPVFGYDGFWSDLWSYRELHRQIDQADRHRAEIEDRHQIIWDRAARKCVIAQAVSDGQMDLLEAGRAFEELNSRDAAAVRQLRYRYGGRNDRERNIMQVLSYLQQMDVESEGDRHQQAFCEYVAGATPSDASSSDEAPEESPENPPSVTDRP